MIKISIAALLTFLSITLFFLLPAPAFGGCCVSPSDTRELVERFTPVLVQGAEVPAHPERILYRTKTSADCRTLFLAYHVVWPFEEDPRPGLYPALTRLTYTGGLGLQRIVYGRGDVEVIGLMVDLETMRVIRVYYESADYDSKGAVIHVPVTLFEDQVPGYGPLVFRVVSWNHMLDLAPEQGAADLPVFRLKPEPFTDALWREYRMIKKIQGPLSKDRAHYAWEREDTCSFPE